MYCILIEYHRQLFVKSHCSVTYAYTTGLLLEMDLYMIIPMAKKVYYTKMTFELFQRFGYLFNATVIFL